MSKIAYLVLEDGSVYEGVAFGAESWAYGEVVFNTSMTGYQETLTDPSYAGQIVMPTYPLIGNYGVNPEDVESRAVQVAGFVVRHHSPHPSHAKSTATIHDYLASHGVPGLSEVDTRAITRKLRLKGVMMGMITNAEPEMALKHLQDLPRYGTVDFVQQVTAPQAYQWEQPSVQETAPLWRIVVTDCGLKYNILRLLRLKGCQVTAVPAGASVIDILALQPHGVVFSPGPGDPALLDYAVEMVKGVVGRVPVMGICLGHQLLARAFGARTFKLKFGHRGGNHPVKDLATGQVYITAQNHGYAVDDETLPTQVEVSHVNLNDGTVEGLRHREMPVLSIQYHSEASPGPRDNEYLFDRFIATVKEVNGS